MGWGEVRCDRFSQGTGLSYQRRRRILELSSDLVLRWLLCNALLEQAAELGRRTHDNDVAWYVMRTVRTTRHICQSGPAQ